ncbi:cell division protein FtsX [Magnetospirillum gryphiswaldense]|jgi:cell division transport system permease protein|uniref:Cell division protein n=2 Tax=Magnetospirillum gryphiswaldense TaxID=55518 RepID=V6F8U0_MAGGM|nr:FtsX-like permease family protein [Magnetospirillum gryphiswaldense]AVM74999.1 cell division ABC transporter subunit FtsX [Magnetospirillum gryphiswaldense MSR-1]AVM78902.1 cell division ABC transporter subunit FtsX [Magnetospirillum gryphiswaldense]CAM75792.1 Cell division protein [Magnetospirillum gryphiswaldense MSR-1]CDL01111.1 putative cell division protein [Magnetospirillum gryphiswaldense MSR-1 v2]
MLGRHSDLPLKGDATSRFLPWLVALMVYLSAVSLAGVFVLNGLVHSWDHDVSGTLTVQVQPVPGEAGEALTDERVRQAVELMRRTQGVLAARALDKKQILALLEPWLGNTDVVKDLPLPRLIDVTIDPDANLELLELADRLARSVPGATLDDHRIWLSRLINLSRTTEWVAIAILVLIGCVTSATVIYATRTSMAVHRGVIEVLHLIGAHDDYIARQFADRSFALGFSGGVIGLALAVPSLTAIGWAARRIEGGFLPSLSLPVTGWVMIAMLPVIAAGLAMLTARLAVHATLARMP